MLNLVQWSRQIRIPKSNVVWCGIGGGQYAASNSFPFLLNYPTYVKRKNDQSQMRDYQELSPSHRWSHHQRTGYLLNHSPQ